MVSILIEDCLFDFDTQRNIFTQLHLIVQFFRDKYPFSYFPAWELRLSLLETPTFKPANSAPPNPLIANGLPKRILIMNNLYIFAYYQCIYPPYPHTLPSFLCLLSSVLMPVFSYIRHSFLW